ncbi:MAG: hypothetical protein ACJ72W_18990 [Actinoallomurus sp.]
MAIKYPNAVFDEQAGGWGLKRPDRRGTAFASKKGQAITARLIVRRIKRVNGKAIGGQDELFPLPPTN